ncbi:MAG: Holliday junction resolvase RuvX [Oscillospiraceae bacterium]|jgi:putative Holliday junction resolvase|nr:Holliday junction resolvase RuvX [Oscillospiraceae bacterium]
MPVIAVDYGDARTGVAISGASGQYAAEAFTIHEKDGGKLIERLCALAAARREDTLFVVGLPVNMDGSEGPRAQKSRAFAAKLREASEINVELCDERLTTVQAARMLKASGSKTKVDALAAALLLEAYLRGTRSGAAGSRPPDCV